MVQDQLKSSHTDIHGTGGRVAILILSQHRKAMNRPPLILTGDIRYDICPFDNARSIPPSSGDSIHIALSLRAFLC
jgi:hypothetical protein